MCHILLLSTVILFIIFSSFIVTVIHFSALFLCVGLYGGEKEAQAVFSI
jgi:hypothetical protein